MKPRQKNWLFALGFVCLGALGLGACGDDSSQKKADTDLAIFIVADMSKVYQCVPSCTTDDQCANSCAPPTSGSSCCDTATNTCFTASTATCPAPLDFSVVGPY
jgi:hypothetical protein